MKKNNYLCSIIITLIVILTLLSCGNKWNCSDVYGAVRKNTEVRLQDDFATSSNKQLILDKGIMRNGFVTELTSDTLGKIIKIIDDNSFVGTDNPAYSNVINLYHLMTDWDTRNRVDLQPLKEQLDRIERIESISDLNSYLKNIPFEEQSQSLFSFYVTLCKDDPSETAIVIDRTDLVFDDPARYREALNSDAFSKYTIRQLFTKILIRLDYDEEQIDKIFRNCMNFEIQLSRSMVTNEELPYSTYFIKKDPYIITKKMMSEVKDKIDFTEIILHLFDIEDFEFVFVTDKAWFVGLLNLMSDENIELIKGYLLIHYVYNILQYDYDSFIIESSDDEEITEYDVKLAVVLGICKLMPIEVMKLYSDYYNLGEKRQSILFLCDKITESFIQLTANSSFPDGIKEKIVKRIESIRKVVFYSDDFGLGKYNQGLNIQTQEEGETFLSAIYKIKKEEILRIRKNLHSKIGIFDVGLIQYPVCGYLFDSNSILLSCHYSLFFSEEMRYEENLARLGFLLSHEIAHSFSDFEQKHFYTSKEIEFFSKTCDVVKSYIDSIPIRNEYRQSAEQIYNELITDIIAIECLLNIAKAEPVFDYDIFFRSFSHLFCFVREKEDVLYVCKTDHHPLNCFRINMILQQFDEFIDCYDIKPGDGMYRKPEERIRFF